MDVALGEFIGAFAAGLGIAVIWLIIAYVIPPLRRSPHISYPIAMALAFLAQLTVGELSYIVAGLLCVVLLFIQMKRAQRKLNPSTTEQE